MTNQILATPDLRDVVAKARALHSPNANATPRYEQIKRLEQERTAARIRAERLSELYEMSGLVFMLPTRNEDYSDE